MSKLSSQVCWQIKYGVLRNDTPACREALKAGIREKLFSFYMDDEK